MKFAKNEEQREAILTKIEEEAWEIGAANVDRVGTPPTSDPEARKFFARATGREVQFLDHVDDWLRSLQVTPKTSDMYRSDANRFAEKFKALNDVTKAEVSRWINDLILDQGVTVKTVAENVVADIVGHEKATMTYGL